MLEGVFNEPVEIAPRTWFLINLAWVVWFAALAAANIYVAQNFPEGVWVKFKVFGITAAMLVFMIPQVIWLNGKVKPSPSEAAPP
jgi:intracellular septation protein